MSLVLSQLASDNFQRANENPLSQGGKWTTLSGGDTPMQIVSDVCEATTTGLDCHEYYTGQTLPNDQYCSLTLASSIQNNAAIYLFARSSGTYGHQTKYQFEIENNYLQVYSWVAGSYTELFAGSVTPNAGDVWVLACVGSQITVLQNGNVICSVTDTSVTAGVAGMGIATGGLALNTLQVSNFACGSASNSSSGGTLPFLGSARTVASAPSSSNSSIQDPFLGTFTVVNSAPAGEANPYLGNFRVVTVAPTNEPNPALGQIVIVGSAPAGDPDNYLGNAID